MLLGKRLKPLAPYSQSLAAVKEGHYSITKQNKPQRRIIFQSKVQTGTFNLSPVTKNSG